MIGIIGGSGFYGFLEDAEKSTIDTPFGNVGVEIGRLNDMETVFIPRHGKNHSIPPSQINYRANIFAMHKLQVEYVIATNAVGSVNEVYKIGDLAIADDLIDFTEGRICTFFDGSELQVKTRSGKILSGVVHTDVTHVYDLKVRDLLISASKTIENTIHENGIMVVSNGPRFESPAEIKAYAKLGGDFVGMTSAPEAFLAKELEIPYATIAVITNFGAGMQNHVSAEEVFEMFSKKIDDVKQLIKSAITA